MVESRDRGQMPRDLPWFFPKVRRREVCRVGRAGEEVTRRSHTRQTVGAVVAVGPADNVLIVRQLRAEAGSQLTKRRTGLTREKSFVGADERRAGVEDAVWRLGVDGVADDVRMNPVYDLLVGCCWDDAVLKIGLDEREAFGAQRFFHLTMVLIRDEGDGVEGRMGRLESACEKLRSQQLNVLSHR